MEMDGNKLYLESQLHEWSVNKQGVIVNKNFPQNYIVLMYTFMSPFIDNISMEPYVPMCWGTT